MKDEADQEAAAPAAPEAAPAAPETPSPRPPSCIYRWDLDKTYLRTEFDSLRALLRTALEKAEEKRTVAGAATLLSELRRPRGGDAAGERARVSFISGSPRQMRKVLTEKLRLDGVEFDEFILKPNLRNLLTGRFRAMREQVGYKLPALLAGRAGVPESVREICFGDDAESDGFIYSLYGDLLEGRVDKPLLSQILKNAGVYQDDALRTITLFESLSRAEVAVERIFIRLDRRSPPRRFERYGPRLVPIYNYFQAALVLFEDQRLDASSVVRVAVEMVDKHLYSLEALRNSLQDLVRRGRLRGETLRSLGAAIVGGERSGDERYSLVTLGPGLGELPGTRETLRALAHGLRDLGDFATPAAGGEPPDPRPPINYLEALEQDLPRHKRSHG